MAKYCFANFKKNKKSSVSHLQKEANREWENEEKYKSEIDFEVQNIYLKKTENWNEKIDEILKENELEARSNSIVMTTTIYGFSEEWEDDLLKKHTEDEVEQIKRAYFEKCYEFEKTRGECINFVIHTDEEGNWHAHAATVPITNSIITKAIPQVDKDGNIKRNTKEGSKSFGKIIYKQEPVLNDDGTPKMRKALSAKTIFGNRSKMSKDQTAFYEYCGKPFGMERGECRIQDAPGAKKHLNEAEYKAKAEAENTKKDAEDYAKKLKEKADKYEASARLQAENVFKTSQKAKIDALKQKESDYMAKLKKLQENETELNELINTIKTGKQASIDDFIDYVVDKAVVVNKANYKATLLKNRDAYLGQKGIYSEKTIKERRMAISTFNDSTKSKENGLEL